tara:strand:+ start:420 stop:659 length:240 start_codon:yes stop_codon:yes gene_type:complete
MSREAREFNRNMERLKQKRAEKGREKLKDIPKEISQIKEAIKLIKLIQQKDPATYSNKGVNKFLDDLEESIKEMQEKLQ